MPGRGVVVIVIVKSRPVPDGVWGVSFEKMGVNYRRVIRTRSRMNVLERSQHEPGQQGRASLYGAGEANP